jgi:pimeloyl-ACP methyl ester carboxylesterase
MHPPSHKPLTLYKTPAGEAACKAAYQQVLSLWPAPYEELQVSTRFGSTHVIACGPQYAPPIVLVHAFFATATVWFPNAAALSQNYRVYAVDCIGEPNLSAPTRPITGREDAVEWFTDLFDALNIERAFMVGNSNGGFLTANMALLAPQRLHKIVLISPAATFAQIWPFYIHMFLPVILGSRPLIRRGLRWFSQDLPTSTDWVRLFQLVMEEGAPTNQIFPAVFSDAELRRMRTPTLLLIGDHEVIYKPQTPIQRALRLVPGLQAEIVPSAHHIAAMANPIWVNPRLVRFFEEE